MYLLTSMLWQVYTVALKLLLGILAWLLVVENVSTIILSMVYVGPNMVATWGFLVKLLRIT
jgi:hypothetical protein